MINSHNITGAYCASPKGWARVVCEHLAVYWKPLRCKQCEGCLRWKTKRVIAQVLTGLEGDEKWKSFVTLTTIQAPSWSWVMTRFQKLVRWLRSTYGPVEYAAIKQEGTSTGMKHLHLLLLGPAWIPYATLSQKWKSISGAWSVDIQRVSSSGVAGYVARYVAAGSVILGKAVTFSKGWLRAHRPQTIDYAKVSGAPSARVWVAVTQTGVKVEWWGPDGVCGCPGRT